MSKKTALVIAPGRGTYNKNELGYIKRHHSDKTELLSEFDNFRITANQETISSLDGSSKFSISKFSRGDNASALIHACAYMDYLSIDREKFEVVAITGNSMGWYTALACANVLNELDAFKVVNTMGNLMQESLIGGQLIYPFVDENWIEIPKTKERLLKLIDEIPNLYLSIHLGGMIVFAGENTTLDQIEMELEPVDGRFPMRLSNHAGFHSPMQMPVSDKSMNILSNGMFTAPEISMIDGRGHVWLNHFGNRLELYEYTLCNQVVETYDFTKAVQNSVKEFAPDTIIVLGPGTSLNSAIAQSLIGCNWRGLTSKADFEKLQKNDPFVLSMGHELQRKMAINS